MYSAIKQPPLRRFFLWHLGRLMRTHEKVVRPQTKGGRQNAGGIILGQAKLVLNLPAHAGSVTFES